MPTARSHSIDPAPPMPEPPAPSTSSIDDRIAMDSARLLEGSRISKSFGSSKKARGGGGSSAAATYGGAFSIAGIFAMALLAVQFGLQSSLTKKFTNKDANKTSLIIVQELIKFFLSGCMLLFSVKDNAELHAVLRSWSFKGYLSTAVIPGIIYAVQNVFALSAQQHLDSVTFNVLNQTKTISGAICLYILMGKKQTMLQCLALLLLAVAAIVIQGILSPACLSAEALRLLPFLPLSPSSAEQCALEHAGKAAMTATTRLLQTSTLLKGIIPCLVASLLSGLAGALSQKLLQGTAKNSYMFSMELSSFSFICLFASLFAPWLRAIVLGNVFGGAPSPKWLDMVLGSGGDGTVPASSLLPSLSMFDKLSLHSFLPLTTSAMGGILVGLVTKHAGVVAKGFAVMFGILLGGVVQSYGEGKPLTERQTIGGTIAVISMWLYQSDWSGASMGKTLGAGIKKTIKNVSGAVSGAGAGAAGAGAGAGKKGPVEISMNKKKISVPPLAKEKGA